MERMAEVEETMSGQFTLSEVKSKVEDFNSVIDNVCGDDERLYDMYRLRMFHKDTEVLLLERPTVISEIDKLYQVNNTMYNLIEYDEIDVDVRRYGEA